MKFLTTVNPVDYLVIGHLVNDLIPNGTRLGGTAAYSALTAQRLGLRTGIVTAWDGNLSQELFEGIQVIKQATDANTTFENIYTPEGRIQILHHQARRIDLKQVPELWKKSRIVHIGPVAQEVDAIPGEDFTPELLALTAQGWMRGWDARGRVSPCAWEGADEAMPKAGAVVISVEDVDKDEETIERMTAVCRVLVVTEGPAGARCYWHNDQRRFHAPVKKEEDATGAGDIFAAAFFYRLVETRDPWEATRFATRLSAFSVTRSGLEGIPTREEVRTCKVEVF